MARKASSIPETMPRGPFTSTGFFHRAKRRLVPLLINSHYFVYYFHYQSHLKTKYKGESNK